MQVLNQGRSLLVGRVCADITVAELFCCDWVNGCNTSDEVEGRNQAIPAVGSNEAVAFALH